tara:strand:+ start:56 stop:247 length:192 start_codon:yes stop_codon:yes gene_type:complete
MEKTYKDKLAKYWDYNINPVTGLKQDKYIDDKFINDKMVKGSNSCMDFIEERALDRHYSEQIK